MPESIATQTLATLLREASRLLDDLISLSDGELAAIEAQSADQLMAIVESKNRTLNEFGENIGRRSKLLNDQGYDASTSGFDQLLAKLPEKEGEALREFSNALEKKLKKAAELNDRNEQVVSRNQRNLKHLIRILQGQQRNNQLYRQNGVVGNYAAQNVIGKA